MLARGIDQILPHPGDPTLHERWMTDARGYVALAERRHGAIPRPVSPSWPWGDALAALDAARPDVRIVNLETSVTSRGAPAPGKGIHYRLSRDNADALSVAALDVCALANNHVLDWGVDGLLDTLDALDALGIARAGAGRSFDEAWRPAVVRGVAVLSVATDDCGVPPAWAATAWRPGVARLDDLSQATADAVAARATSVPGAAAVVSIQWGGNWGYEVGADEVAFARRLIARGVRVVHGHSSHHPRRVDVIDGQPVLYGCGELLDDYEGISGYEAFRPDLVLLWLVDLGADGALVRLEALPMCIRRMRLERASDEQVAWLARIHGLVACDGRLALRVGAPTPRNGSNLFDE